MVRAILSIALTLLLLPVLACSEQSTPVTSAQCAKAFDQLWTEMDRLYSYFEHRKTDWSGLKTKYRPQAEAATTNKEFVGVLQKMLAELKDQHIWIDGAGPRVVPFQQPWEKNWSFPGIRAHLATSEMVGKFVSVSKMKEGYGYLFMENQGAATPELGKLAAEKIEALKDVPGFIVDLRAALGGNETYSMPLASAFCAKPTVYAKFKNRNGAGHGDFGPIRDRILAPSKNPFTKPVVVILGPAVMSSGEGLTMMFAALPNVTTVGSPTRGSSGNPMPVELKDVGVTVMFSRWVAMLPDNTPIEGRGVIPQVEARFPASAFGATDPVLEKAIQVLKEKLK